MSLNFRELTKPFGKEEFLSRISFRDKVKDVEIVIVNGTPAQPTVFAVYYNMGLTDGRLCYASFAMDQREVLMNPDITKLADLVRMRFEACCRDASEMYEKAPA